MPQSKPEEDYIISNLVENYIKGITPFDARILDENTGVPWLSLRVCCNGTDKTFGYYCILKPNHSGLCFSRTKDIFFKREN